MYITTLNAREISLARTLAEERQEVNRRENVGGFNNWEDDAGYEHVEPMGIAGEMALAKILKTYFQVSQEPAYRLKEVDIEFNGRRIDVKTSFSGRALNCTYKEWITPPVDIYALMVTTEDLDVFTYGGYALYEDLIRPENILPGVWRNNKQAPDYYSLLQRALIKELP